MPNISLGIHIGSQNAGSVSIASVDVTNMPDTSFAVAFSGSGPAAYMINQSSTATYDQVTAGSGGVDTIYGSVTLSGSSPQTVPVVTTSLSDGTYYVHIVKLGGTDDDVVNSASFEKTSASTDGTDLNDTAYLENTSFSDSGASDAGLFVASIRWDTLDSGYETIFSAEDGSAYSVLVRRLNLENFQVLVRDASANVILTMGSTSNVIPAGWFVLMASWDGSASLSHLYVGDTNVENGGATVHGNYTRRSISDVRIGLNRTGTDPFSENITQILFANTYVDLSVEANRREFVDASGYAVQLADWVATNGALVHLTGNPSEIVSNGGSGGDFTMAGSGATTSTTNPYA